MEFVDYTFYDHFGCFLPSFLPRPAIYDYFVGRANAGSIRRFIRFNTTVRHVDFNEKTNDFDIDIENLDTGSTERMNFDRVVVATGHYHVPNMIEIEGVSQFSGRVLHSHDFRGADEFKGLNLLIVGGSFSADDIALQCYKFGARSITISSQQEPVGFKWPNEIKGVPMLTHMEGQTAHFKDGSTVEHINAIIFCTGYRHSYPFIAKRFQLSCGLTEFVPSNLYKSIFWIDQPYLAYLGAPRQIYSFPMFDVQAALVRDVFLGHVTMPDKDQCKANVEEWQRREQTIGHTDFFAMIDLQTDYLRDVLASLHTHDRNQPLAKFDYDKACNTTKEFLKNKLADILHYRDASYESIVDMKNKKVIKVCKPWIENMDDSMESLLDNYRTQQ